MSTTLHPDALRREAGRGAATMLPLLVGYLPFALIIGVAAGRSSEPLAAWSGGLLIMAGSAHLTVIELVGQGSGLVGVVVTALLINARLTVYSASLVPLWKGASLRARLLAAAAVIDPTLMLATRRRTQPGTLTQQRAYYAGAAVVLAIGWAAMIAAGIALGAQQSAAQLLAICTPLCLAAIVGPHLRTAAGVRCVVAAATVALATSSWPAGSGLLLAMAVGAVSGGWRAEQVSS